MISEREFSNLVASIYEAGADFGLWPDTLQRLAKAYDGKTAVLLMTSRNVDEMRLIAPDIDPSINERYAAHFHAIDPLSRLALPAPVGTVMTDTMLMPKRELTRTEFFHDFLRPQELGSMLGTIGHVDAGRCVNVVVQRQREFEARDVEMQRRLARHLQRALELNLKLERLGMQCTASAEALERLGQGALLVDAACRVLFANGVSERLVGTGGALRLVDGILCARSAADSDKLQALVRSCASLQEHGAGGSMSLSRGTHPSAIKLSILPLRTEVPAFQLMARPVAIIVVADPDSTPVSSMSERVRRRYGLTPKETAFALEMLEGDGIQACADRLGMSRATARTHLAHIFQKTGARRQAELVRLLLQTGGAE